MKHFTITKSEENGQPIYNTSGNMTLNEVSDALITLAYIAGANQAKKEISYGDSEAPISGP
jgi:hypothetical protein